MPRREVLLPQILLQEPLRIGLFGEFSAGKSTLLNSLVGADLQATGVRPTTMAVTVLRHAAQHALLPSGASLVPLDCELTRLGVEMWDTPGPNSENPQHAQRAQAAASEVDLALLLVPANDGVTRTLQALFQRILQVRQSKGRSSPWIMLTKYDRLEYDDETERIEVEQELADQIHEQLPGCGPLFRVNSQDLGRFEGLRLQHEIQQYALHAVKERLAAEVKRDRQHPLRQRIAIGENWREDVPASLVSPALSNSLTAWEAHCLRAQKLRWALRWRAIWGLPRECVEKWLFGVDDWFGGAWTPKQVWDAMLHRITTRKEYLSTIWTDDLP